MTNVKNQKQVYKNLKTEMQMYMDAVGSDSLYAAAVKLADTNDQPTPEQLGDLAELLLETMEEATGNHYNAWDFRDAMEVVSKFVQEERED